MSFRTSAVTLLLLAACASKRPPEQKEIHGGALPKKDDAAIPGAWKTAAEKGEVPDGWLKTFHDPAMEALVGEALRDNLVLRGAAARVDMAAGIAKQAAAALKPTIGLGGTAGGIGLAGGEFAPTYGVGLQFAWEADVWGRLRALRDASDERFRGAQADFEFARQSLGAQMAKSWFLATEARLQLELASESVAIFERILKIVEAKRAQGRVTAQDIRLASANLGSAKERVRAADSVYRQTLRALEILLGRYPAAEIKVAAVLAEPPPPVPTGLPSELLERRQDLVAAERRVKAAFLDTEAAKLTKLPRIQLTGSGGVVNNDVLELVGRGPSFFNAGANFFQPVYTGGAIEATIEIQTARQEAALAEYGQRALVAFGEVENSLTNNALLKERVELQRGVVDDNAEAARLARAQYEAGRIELLDVLQIQQRELSARSFLISLRDQFLAERVNLHLALGGSFE